MLLKALKVTACFLLFLMYACSPNQNMQGQGTAGLQGEWQQQPEAVHQKLVNYTLYHFKFSCDSFYVTLHSFSKVNSGADTCMNRGNWKEYAKGRYEQHNDTLFLRGLFCQANFKLKYEGGCFRTGVYEEEFRVKKLTNASSQLNSTSAVLPINLQLIKRTGCTPKPLY